MNFRQFIFRNTLRNKHLYLAYFLSTLFTVMTFFTFMVFAFQPNLTKGLADSVKTAMIACGGIIFVFSFFYVLYSMDIFLQSRKHEFGTLMIQGMSPKQLRKMVFIENILVGFFATVAGILVGLGFSQIILWASSQYLKVNMASYFPFQAIGITFVAFLLLFLCISVFIQLKLPKLNVQDLLKSNVAGKGQLKTSGFKAVAGIILIAVGYIVALIVPGMMVPIVMIPVIVVVILGTQLLFNQFTVKVVQLLTNNKQIFWKKTNMLVFSDLAYRMKDNARSFFLVAVISTVAFSAMGTLFGVRQLLLGGVASTPYEFQMLNMENTKAQEKKAEKFNIAINKVSQNSQKTTIVFLTDGENSNFIKESDYNILAKSVKAKTLKTNGKAIGITNPQAISANKEQVKKIAMKQSISLVIEKTEESPVLIGFGNQFVIPDNVFEKVNNDYQKIGMTVWNPKDLNRTQLIKLGNKGVKDNIYGKVAQEQQIIDSYAPILFIGLFIGIVFFISAGSFLYFRLYSDMDVDIKKFTMVYKLGLTKSELRKMIYQQVAILFFTPIIISTIHGAVALTAMYHIFDTGLQLTAVGVLGTFLVIQILYYVIASTFYFKKVYRTITQNEL